jgi:NTP pyrophosphatase (non-canonical NTP hydrolase)
MDIQRLQKRLREFTAARDWEQFHSPKNLAMALVAEVGELVEQFQWLTDEQSRQLVDQPKSMEPLREELADVTIYLLRLADTLSVDLEAAVDTKIAINEIKYPVDASYGNATKYNRR